MPRMPMFASLHVRISVTTVMAALFVHTAVPASESPKHPPLRLVAGSYPVHIMLLNIAGSASGVTITNVASPDTGCLHNYSVTASDMATLSRADVLVLHGAEFEASIQAAARNNSKIAVIDASQGTDLIRASAHSHAHREENEATVNPHVWVSPIRNAAMVMRISTRLAALNPPNASNYLSSAVNYTAQLDRVACDLREVVSAAATRDIVTQHMAFDYLARDFGLTVAGVVQTDPDVEPSPSDVVTLIKTMRSLRIRTVFSEPQSASKSVALIARETGAEVVTLDPAAGGPLHPDAYIRTMQRNIATLRKTLGNAQRDK